MNDVFISYAHIDNESLTEGQQGWISQFHHTLEVRLRQLMGENPDDPASVDAPPYGPVFIAMTRFQLGEQEQAADLLNKIKAKADQVKEKDPQGKRLDLFIKEAESLIQNEKKEP
jgi:hypothetical protein